jgi:predicted dehydrogenase
LECQAFLDAITSRQPPLTDGKSGLRVLSVLEAAQRSLVMNGEPVALSFERFGER